ncbi:MAG: sensor histidine kinase [Lachnospiraceae bacterium]|jgi:two-component system sensor histidine kinase KdpD
MIPDTMFDENRRSAKVSGRSLVMRDIGKSLLVLVFATLIGSFFDFLGFMESNIVAVYILGVLITSIITTNRIYGLFSSVASVLLFNFFFTVPRFTFLFINTDYAVTFAIIFTASFLTGTLATKLKENAKNSAQAAFRTSILLETNQLLQKERDDESILRVTAEQLTKLFDRDVVIYPASEGKLMTPSLYPACGDRNGDVPKEDKRKTFCKRGTVSDRNEDILTEKERLAAEAVLESSESVTGKEHQKESKCIYLPIEHKNTVYGVVGIYMDESTPESFENSVMLSILGECALAMESMKNAREKEAAAVLAKNEQLRANLLRAISHDLRTPLTSISGSAGNLMANYDKMDDSIRIQTFTDIYDDSMWLISLVENLLAVTRIESEEVKLNRSVEVMDEVIAEAMRHINRKSREHAIKIIPPEDLFLADIDAKLIVQVVINLIDNAIKYTQPGSIIEIGMKKDKDMIRVSVSDDGPGIPDAQKSRIFEMFYSGADKVADSRRSLGLGLFLCRSIITVHGGTIDVSDNDPHGSVFSFTVPAGEVIFYE